MIALQERDSRVQGGSVGLSSGLVGQSSGLVGLQGGSVGLQGGWVGLQGGRTGEHDHPVAEQAGGTGGRDDRSEVQQRFEFRLIPPPGPSVPGLWPP